MRRAEVLPGPETHEQEKPDGQCCNYLRGAPRICLPTPIEADEEDDDARDRQDPPQVVGAREELSFGEADGVWPRRWFIKGGEDDERHDSQDANEYTHPAPAVFRQLLAVEGSRGEWHEAYDYVANGDASTRCRHELCHGGDCS